VSVGDRLSARLDEAIAAVPARRHVQSVVVVRAGETLAERYYRDRRAEDLSNTHSVTKSFLATLVGIALGDGRLELETPVVELLGERDPFAVDERKRLITVRHLLTMTSGLDPGSPHDIDEIADRGESWLDGPLAAPLVAEPGKRFAYNNGAAHVLSVATARAVGRPLGRFAEERLFGPLGIDSYRWPADPEGNPLGYGHLEVRPRDLARLGRLYLEGGRVDGEQLLPAGFAADATRAQSRGGPPEGVAYGYLWWVTEDCGFRSFFAGGYAGQYVTVVPALELVVVSTGDAAVFIETSRNLRRLVAEVVVPTITALDARGQAPS
jgi:CubicO group peptidase (beta-lactamase class C family)